MRLKIKKKRKSKSDKEIKLKFTENGENMKQKKRKKASFTILQSLRELCALKVLKKMVCMCVCEAFKFPIEIVCYPKP